MQKFRLLALVLSIFYVTQVYAQEKLTCSKNGTLVTFTNGINTSLREAEEHLDKITALLPATDLDQKGKVKYKLTYNLSETIALDLYESVLQKIATYYNISLVRAAFRYTAIVYSVVTFDIALAEELSGIVSAIVGRIDLANELTYQATLQKHLEIWTPALNAGQKIIAISHSQGGLFLNDAYQKLMATRGQKDRNLFAMLQVATPASLIAAVSTNGTIMGAHLTNDHDLIQIVTGSLPANINLSLLLSVQVVFSDVLAHNFGDVYLKYFTPQLQAKLKSMALLLDSNCKVGCEKQDGTFEQGHIYVNPDGREGGFVADTAIILNSTISKNVEICGDTAVYNSSIIALGGNIKIIGDLSLPMYPGHTSLFHASEISGSIILILDGGTGSMTFTNVAMSSASINFFDGKLEIKQSSMTGNSYGVKSGEQMQLTNIIATNSLFSGTMPLNNSYYFNCVVNNGITSSYLGFEELGIPCETGMLISQPLP